jgi:glucose/mannose-6-phosphate isomerase
MSSSYSGNTAETLALFEEARARGCRVIALTSGGELESRADEGGVPVVRVPGGLMPRAAFGYTSMASVGALVAVGLSPSFDEDLAEAVGELERIVGTDGPAVAALSNDAKGLALRLVGRVPVVWGAEGFARVAAARWKTQFNENAKIPAFASSLPELDHNEVVGWSSGQGDPFAVVALRHDGEDPDVAGRFPLSLEIARSSGAVVEEVRASGRSALARLLSLVQRGDLVSTYLGIARGVDPSPIDAIVRLKAALADA